MNETSTISTQQTAITFFANIGAISKMLGIGIEMQNIHFSGRRLSMSVTNASFAELWSHLPGDDGQEWTLKVTQLFQHDMPKVDMFCTVATLEHDDWTEFRTTFWNETMNKEELCERLAGLLNSSSCIPSMGEESSGGEE